MDKVQAIDPTGELLRAFQTKIAQAQHHAMVTGGTMESAEIEADKTIIDYFNPNGLGEGKFFIYQGVKVYPQGEMEKIKAEDSASLVNKLHGNFGTVVSP
ncbi:hypothetical protein [Microcystis sp. M061S2]|uniref:hypothetical protein n=1 Tax=Microcystis sp. M061S2 TaxID=2771171 RepID=UPI0025847D88|nr:hypothetical protein [Microcystis sp. M061S2]MCA2656872.1 hypothetical protein [Microcystis sp. M061S2]